MRHHKALLVLTLMFALGLATGAAAERTSDSQWIPEIAKQLVSVGWEETPAVGQQSVIIYALRFERLSVVASSAYEYALGTASGTSGPDGWAIETDEDLLQFVSTYGLSTRLDAGLGQNTAAHLGQEVWLVTVDQEPVRLAIQEESIGSNGRTTEELSIALKPERIDSQGRRILTRFAFQAKSHSGAETKTETTLWTKSEQPQLVAIVTRYTQDGYKSASHHYGLYLQGILVAPEQLPDTLAVLPIGNVGAFQNLFPQPGDAWQHPRFGFVFTIDSQQSGSHFETEIFFRTVHNHRISVAAGGRASDPFWYSAGIDFNIVDNLAFVTRVEGEHEGAMHPVLRLGLTEETQVTPMVRAAATVLPFAYIPGTGLTTDGWSAEVMVLHRQPGWALFFETHYAGRLENTVGISLYPMREQEVQLRWTHTPGGQQRWSVRGVALQW